MKSIRYMIPILMLFLLSACSSGQVPRKKKKTSPTPTSSESSFPSKLSPTPAKTTTATKAKSEHADAPAAGPTAAKTNANAADGGAKVNAFPDDYVSGKTLGQWAADLDSGDKEKIVEACGVCEIAGSKAIAAKAKLEALTKHKDKDIADAARSALTKVK